MLRKHWIGGRGNDTFQILEGCPLEDGISWLRLAQRICLYNKSLFKNYIESNFVINPFANSVIHKYLYACQEYSTKVGGYF